MLTRYRGWIVVIFVLPMSFVWQQCAKFRNLWYQTFISAPQAHAKRVANVQSQVRRWKASGTDKLMCTARPAWASMSVRTATYKNNCHRIEVNLRDILDIDLQRQVVRGEPMVTVGQLMDRLNAMGWMLAVNVEMDDLTIGGLCMGLGMGTNSHRFGLIHTIVEAYEVVLGDGSLIRASKTAYADLFHALPWSHGTLGFLVSVELRIIPTKPYIHLTYLPCYTQDEFFAKFQALATADNPPEFLEATIYSRHTAVITCGSFADVVPDPASVPINRINYWFKPWFYKHVEQFLATGEGAEYIPLRHYYYRHTRSIFWALEDIVPFGNHPLYRWCLGWLGAPKIALIKRFRTQAIRRMSVYSQVYQEAMIPITQLQNAIELFHALYEVYPLLVYPIRIYRHETHQGFLRNPRHPLPGKNYAMFCDLGAYGIPKAIQQGGSWDAVRSVRAMEKFSRDCGGYSPIYVDLFMTRREFEAMFDHTFYRDMRAKYGALGAFPEVYDKVRGSWPGVDALETAIRE